MFYKVLLPVQFLGCPRHQLVHLALHVLRETWYLELVVQIVQDCWSEIIPIFFHFIKYFSKIKKTILQQAITARYGIKK